MKKDNNCEKYYLDIFEKLNKDYLDLYFSREHKLGYDFFHFNIKVIMKYIRFIISRLKKNKKEKTFYNKGDKINNNLKGVVYTCVTNNYDGLKEPLYKPDNLDFKIFTDYKLNNVDTCWQYCPLPLDNNKSIGNFAN